MRLILLGAVFIFVTNPCLGSDCVEEDTDYWFNDVSINGRMNIVLPDVQSCQKHCRSHDIPFFAWRGDSTDECWCKTKLDTNNKKNTIGSFAGRTKCGAGKDTRCCYISLKEDEAAN